MLRRAELEELLYDVVAEDVGHEGVRARRDLLKDEALLLRRGALQLLLDEAAAVLVLAELHHVRLQLAQRDVRVAVVPAKKRIDFMRAGQTADGSLFMRVEMTPASSP